MNIWQILLFGISFVPSRHCPRTCSCLYETDSHPSILIDCTNLELDRFPLNSSILESDFCRHEGAKIEIDLSRNKITQVTLPSLKGLNRINLSYNEISQVKNTVIKDAGVRELDLSHNKKLEKVTTDLKSESLESLVASQCSINEIEEGFLENLPLLKSLDLSYNDLKELNSFVTSKAIHLDKLDKGSGDYFQLNFLNVSHNRLQKIEGRNFRLMKIKILDVSNNGISHFKFTPYFRHLEELYASDNGIETFDGMLLPNVRILDASKNKLADAFIDLTEKAPKLEILNLSGSFSGKVPEIKSLTVSHLDVSHCRIRDLGARDFSMLEQLKRLDLNGNELAIVGEDVLINFRNLESLHLGMNPWKCDCESTEFQYLYNFVLFDRAYSDGKDLLCQDNGVLTWDNVCRSHWNYDNDVDKYRKSSLNALIYILITLLVIIALISCYTFVKDAMRSNTILLNNSPDAVCDIDENIASRSNARDVETRDIPEETVPPSYVTRRSTPPPNYEAALLLPVLTEEEREMAISNLSLDRTTA